MISEILKDPFNLTKEDLSESHKRHAFSRIVEQKIFCLHAQLRLSNFLVHSCEKESSLWLYGLVGYNLVKIKARHLRCCKQCT